MKRIKCVIEVIMITILCGNYAFAENSHTETKEKITNMMVTNLDKEVNLTDSQKIVVNQKASIYAENLVKARLMDDKKAAYEMMTAVTVNYEAVIDSILTSDQKVQKETKQKERIEKIVNKMESK